MKTWFPKSGVPFRAFRARLLLLVPFLSILATPACSREHHPYEKQLAERVICVEPDRPPMDIKRVVPPATPLKLQHVLAIALANNPQLQAQKYDAQIAGQGVKVARGMFLPQLTLSATAYELDQPIQFQLPGGLQRKLISQFFWTSEAQLQQLIWDFGNALGRYRQTQNASRIAELTYQRSRQELVLATTEAYFRLLRAQRDKKIAEEGLAAAQLQLKTAQALFEQDLVAKDDVLRAKVQVSEFHLQVISAKNLIELSRSALNKYMGVGIEYNTEICDIIERPEFNHSLRDALEMAVNNRPEFEQIQESIAYEEAGLAVARAAFLPEVFAGGTYVYIGDPAVEDHNVLAALAGIRLKIFSGGADFARYKQAKLMISRALVAANDICDNIALQVKQALLGVDNAQERIDVAQSAVVQAKENLKIAQQKYQQNLSTPTQIADAQAALVQTQQNYYGAIYDLQVALARLRFATGVNDQGIRETKDIPLVDSPEVQ